MFLAVNKYLVKVYVQLKYSRIVWTSSVKITKKSSLYWVIFKGYRPEAASFCEDHAAVERADHALGLCKLHDWDDVRI